MAVLSNGNVNKNYVNLYHILLTPPFKLFFNRWAFAIEVQCRRHLHLLATKQCARQLQKFVMYPAQICSDEY